MKALAKGWNVRVPFAPDAEVSAIPSAIQQQVALMQESSGGQQIRVYVPEDYVPEDQ